MGPAQTAAKGVVDAFIEDVCSLRVDTSVPYQVCSYADTDVGDVELTPRLAFGLCRTRVSLRIRVGCRRIRTTRAMLPRCRSSKIAMPRKFFDPVSRREPYAHESRSRLPVSPVNKSCDNRSSRRTSLSLTPARRRTPRHRPRTLRSCPPPRDRTLPRTQRPSTCLSRRRPRSKKPSHSAGESREESSSAATGARPLRARLSRAKASSPQTKPTKRRRRKK